MINHTGFFYSDDDPNMAGVSQSMCIGAIVAGVVKTLTNILLFIGCLKHKVVRKSNAVL